jgi:hypothetical protein
VVPRQRIAEECDLLVDDHPEEPVRVEIHFFFTFLALTLLKLEKKSHFCP